MKPIHLNKLSAILSMKWRTLLSKNFIIMPIFSLGITVVMNLVYGSLAASEGGEMNSTLRSMAAGLGALTNTAITGIACTGMALAEEKEKHTLRALMTSSVNGLEFFLGSILPAAALITAVNALIIPAAGLRLPAAGWGIWLGISLLCALASSVIGMIFGLCAKNQVTASTLTTVPMLVLVLTPTIGAFNATAEKISRFLFTGVLSNTVSALAEGAPRADLFGLSVIGAEIVLTAAVFLLVYRKNGYDPD